MASHVSYTGLDRINRHLAGVIAETKAGSRTAQGIARSVKQALYRDNRFKLEKGLDRKERPLARLAASTLADRRRSPGGPLFPGNAGSFVTKFVVEETTTVGSAIVKLHASYAFPYARYHIEGRPKGSKKSQPNWSLPKRDVGGVTLRGREEIRLIGRDAVRLAVKYPGS